MKCPRCDAALRPIEYDGQTVQVCSDCKGEWLASGELEKIVEHHDEIFSKAELNSLDPVNKEIQTVESADHEELNCPLCEGVRMEHFNYGDTSGIILHKCTECGGIWMDKDQLLKVEEVVDGWKADLGKDVEQYGQVLDKIEVQEQKELDRDVSISHIGFVNALLRRFCE
jgi:Zn-finger nucleic acid-binding protein